MEKIKKIVPWVFSVFMLLLFSIMRPLGISHLLLLAAGLSIMPPVVKWINKRKKYGSKIKWCMFIILFIISICAYKGNENLVSKSNNNTTDSISQSEEQDKKQQAEEKAKQQEEEKRQAEEKTKQQEEEKRQAEEKAKQQEEEKQKSSTNLNENKNNSRIVYVTPYGTRYHYSSICAGKNARATTKDKTSLDPCEKCAQ